MEELSYWKFNINRKKKYEEWVGKGRRFVWRNENRRMEQREANVRVLQEWTNILNVPVYCFFQFRISMLNILLFIRIISFYYLLHKRLISFPNIVATSESLPPSHSHTQISPLVYITRILVWLKCYYTGDDCCMLLYSSAVDNNTVSNRLKKQ